MARRQKATKKEAELLNIETRPSRDTKALALVSEVSNIPTSTIHKKVISPVMEDPAASNEVVNKPLTAKRVFPMASSTHSYSNAAQSPAPSRLATSSPLITDTPPQPKQFVKESRSPSRSPIVHQDLDNLLEMIRQQRDALLEGPRITIRIGNKCVEGIAKRAAMAASSTLHKHFTKYPEALEYRFPKGQINPGAVSLILVGWMEETCKEFEAYAVPFQKTPEEDVVVLRACRMLGMERYCKHILDEYVDYLGTHLPTYKEIFIIEQNAIHDKDPLWTAMVNHLCHERYRSLIPDVEEFRAFLESHLRLRKAMESADNFFADYARKQAEMRRRQRWEHNQAEKRERIERELRTAESLQRKLDTRGSGLLTLTADEAEMLRARTC
jgi:hypothetical protein